MNSINRNQAIKPNCNHDFTKAYIQFECKVQPEIIKKNQIEDLTTSASGIIASIMFTLVIWTLKL